MQEHEQRRDRPAIERRPTRRAPRAPARSRGARRDRARRRSQRRAAERDDVTPEDEEHRCEQGREREREVRARRDAERRRLGEWIAEHLLEQRAGKRQPRPASRATATRGSTLKATTAWPRSSRSGAARPPPIAPGEAPQRATAPSPRGRAQRAYRRASARRGRGSRREPERRRRNAHMAPPPG